MKPTQLPTKTKLFQIRSGVPAEKYVLDHYEQYNDPKSFGKALATISGKAQRRQKEGYLTQRFNQNPSSRYSEHNYPGYIALYIRK
jgi:ribosomal protein S17E